MKRLQKVVRVQLKVNHIDDFIIFGIVSAEPDYKLSFLLNNKFKISLKNILPVKIDAEGGKELIFSRFSDSSSTPGTVFNLISNRSGKHYLLKKLKNVDYLFQVVGSENIDNINHNMDRLREIDSVTAVFVIDKKGIKDKNFQYLTH